MDRLGIVPLAHRNMATLSGGEVRRVALARVLTQNPQVLLLDEPAAYLDLKYQAELLGMLRHFSRKDGLAVVLTVHDLPLAALCADRVALLAGGHLQCTGTPEEVLRPEVLQPVYGNALDVIMHPRAKIPLVLPTFPQPEGIRSLQ
jgi:iron complex transport system ATP-binding protein